MSDLPLFKTMQGEEIEAHLTKKLNQDRCIEKLEKRVAELERNLAIWEALDSAHKQQLNELMARSIEKAVEQCQTKTYANGYEDESELDSDGWKNVCPSSDLIKYAQKLRGIGK